MTLDPSQEAASAAENTVKTGSTDSATVRVGSPFRGDPKPAEFVPQAAINEAVIGSPARYTALGAVAASALVLLFAASGALWYPSGGVLVAALGCTLAVGGLFSARKKTSLGLLTMHLGLFLAAASRSIL